jgi:hypothetical protein
MLPEDALTDDVLDTSNTTYALTSLVSVKVRFHIKSLRLKRATGQFRQQWDSTLLRDTNPAFNVTINYLSFNDSKTSKV